MWSLKLKYSIISRPAAEKPLIKFLRFAATLSVRIQVFDWGIREGINKSQEWADIASRKKAIARIP
jgi:hypothetical protein